MGLVRAPVRVTRAGHKLAAAWLTKPASHTRDVRSERLAKLAPSTGAARTRGR